MSPHEEMLRKMSLAFREADFDLTKEQHHIVPARAALAVFCGPDCERCLLKPERCGMSVWAYSDIDVADYFRGPNCPASKGE